MKSRGVGGGIAQEILYCLGELLAGLLEIVAGVLCEVFAELLTALFRL